MKTIVTIIFTELVTNLLLSFFFVLFYKPKARIRFPASWWSGNEKYFRFLFITSHALLQNHADFNRFLKRDYLTCYSCLYYSSMLMVIEKWKILQSLYEKAPILVSLFKAEHFETYSFIKKRLYRRCFTTNFKDWATHSCITLKKWSKILLKSYNVYSTIFLRACLIYLWNG